MENPNLPGWYPAHDMVNTIRWWDGSQWGETAPMPARPIPAPQPLDWWQTATAVGLGVLSGGSASMILFGAIVNGG